jgi:hypothetical protein
MRAEACPSAIEGRPIQKSLRFPRNWTSGKVSGRNRWVSTSMATLPTPFTGYSTRPGLTELLRLYACGLQPSPVGPAFIVNDEPQRS